MSGRVICLGEGLIDRLFGRPDPSENPLANWQDLPGGAPANVASALVKLGTPADFVGCLGPDAPGQRLIQTLQAAGVGCDAVQRHPSAPTRIVLVMRDAKGDRQFVGFHLPDPAGFADAHLQAEALDESLFAGATYLVMGTLGLAYPGTGAAMAQALTWAQQYGLTTIVDINWRPAFWPETAAASEDDSVPSAPAPSRSLAPQRILSFLDRVDLLKLSQEEAHWLFQTDDPLAILSRLPQLKAVLVTAGAQGCCYATPQGQGKLPAYSIESEDTTGAGDAFLAGFVHQLDSRGLESLQDPSAMEQILRYASAVGALTTMRPGAMAAQPRANEVEAFIYLNPLP
ncbi:MAG: carbohydrate kinase [Cyanobacteria bacterium Co-bin13]|nr:carbohydrate kinase [Cyanobacteria bacterium Co-bin13]